MVAYADIILILISAFTFGLYSIFIKKISLEKLLIILFWVHTITYLGFFSVYLFRKFFLEHDVYAIEQLIHEFTIINAPLYILMGLSFLGSFIILNKLIVQYDVSKVLAFAQISILFTVIGYIILGDPFSWSSLIGAFIVSIGAVVSAFDTFHFPNILKPLFEIPKKLWIGILCEALLLSLAAFITFILTQKTAVDQFVMDSLKHVFPFSFHNPFYFNLGARFFIMAIFLIYLYKVKKHGKLIITTLKENLWSILLISFAYFVSAYTYQDAYRLTTDKNVLAALSKLSIPIVLALSTLMLGEKLTAPKIVGSLLIILGGLVVLFF